MVNCLHSEYCRHYATGDSRPKNHQVRMTIPCKRYIAMDCEMMVEVMTMETFCMGKVQACDLEKVRKVKKGVK